MVVIESEKCVGCGLCARICHEDCILLANGNGNQVKRNNHSLCSTCTQCIAVCPQGALSWNHTPPTPNDKSLLPSGEQLSELLKQRRTTRHFKKIKIERKLIEEIISYAIYAPTNNYALRAIAVDDPETIRELDTAIMRFVSYFYSLCYRSSVIYNLLRLLTPEINPKNRLKLARGLQKGRSYDSLHTTLIFIVGDRRILQSEASAQYAIYNMGLLAQALGLGSRIKAAGAVVLNRNRTARKRLGLRNQEYILGTLELGYPAVKFSNKVEGKTMSIHWSERE
jgi:Fe-S-cluster-containing hydrogenase component 2